MASLLKANYYTNLSINRRRIIIITPTPTTRISLPITQKIINIPTFTQTSLPKITTPTTKCSSRGSTFSEEEEDLVPIERLGEPILKALVEAVKGLEKPALTAILVWVLLTNNPTNKVTIAAFASSSSSSSSSRTPIFWGIWFVYDLCKAIASRRRIRNGRIRFSLGPVLGSIMLFVRALMAVFGFDRFGIVTPQKEGSEITIIHKIYGYMMIFMTMFMLMLLGFGYATLKWPPWSKEDGTSVNTDDDTQKKY